VSASTEEQSASAEQMGAGAHELAALATGLTELVGRFTLEAATIASPVTVARNTRASRVA
jgi:hypothetical protein